MTKSLKTLVLATVFLASLPGLRAEDAPEFDQHLQRGFAALNSGAYKQALSELKTANKLKHGQCDACYLGMAAAHLHLHDLGSSLDYCKKAISCTTNPRYKAEAYKLWGDALMHGAADPKRLAEAVAKYQQSTGSDPSYPVAHLDLGVALLRQEQEGAGIAELQKFLQLSPSGSDADLARKLVANPDRARFEYAPEFQATTSTGEKISLAQFAGKVVVLDFWATWCPACRDSVPEIKRLTKKYGGGQLQVISISCDRNAEAWQSFIAKKGMDWLQVRDSDNAIDQAFDVLEIPTYVVVDPKGVIRQRIIGTNPQQSIVARLKTELAKMLE